MSITALESGSPVAMRLSRVTATPPPAPGFIGPGHTAVEVLEPRHLEASDPFVLLMDDRLDLPARRQIGGPHPHAGLETVTLVLEGTIWDRHEGELTAGEIAWMTAGRGVVHNEHVEAAGHVRILQLWIGLPSRVRDVAPAFKVLHRGEVPVRSEQGAVARVYSGRSGSVASSLQTLLPVTLVELVLEPGAQIEQELPASYRGFLYVVSGELTVSGDPRVLKPGEVGWFEGAKGASAATVMSLAARHAGARVVLYAGEPHGEALVQRGPFVAQSGDGLAHFFRQYQAGRFTPLSEVV
jgi:redox-sensitive bicupin YhaK (pirin superfamily)